MTPNPEDRLGGTDGLEFEPVEPRPQPKRHWGRWISFAVVVVVGAGGGWYFFGDQLAMMTPEKSVPIIRADVAPIKIKPADPGGLEVPDRDKLVYDRLNGEGAGTNVERLLPPPETPLPIPEDQLQGDQPEQAVAEVQPLVPETAAAEQQDLTQQMLGSASEQTAAVDPNAPVPLQPSSATETPATPEAPPPPPAPVEPVEVAPVVAPEPTPTALEPTPAAPEQETTQQVAASATQPAAPETTVQQSGIQSQATASATTAATKEYRIQIAALRSHERAEAEWNRQKKAHPDILGGLKLFVVRVDLGEDNGGVFFRLRAGPLKDLKAAKQLCGELAKRNVGCLVIHPGK